MVFSIHRFWYSMSSMDPAGLVLGKEEGDVTSLLDDVLHILEKEPALIELDGRIAFAGDTHGDVVTTRAVLSRCRSFDHLVFLGDYVDREPEPGWSLENILTLLQAKVEDPERIILLKGNHEANAIIPCFPCEFDREVSTVFGSRFVDKFNMVFSELPCMVLCHRVFAAHGGFPSEATLDELRTASKTDRLLLESVLWNDPVVSKTFRGVGSLFTEDELLRFLKRINASVFLRSHDYQRTGESIYDDHCLTIFSARQYQTMGRKGILAASIDHDVNRASELHVEDFSTGSWLPYQVSVMEDEF
jgi:protein phosphatase